MSENVVKLVPPIVGEDYRVPVNQVLDRARDKLTEVLVIGTDLDGQLYVAGSKASPGDALWAMECAKKLLLSGYEP